MHQAESKQTKRPTKLPACNVKTKQHSYRQSRFQIRLTVHCCQHDLLQAGPRCAGAGNTQYICIYYLHLLTCERDSEHPRHDQQKPVPDLRARLRLHARRDEGSGSGKAGFGRVGMRVFHSGGNGAHVRRVPRGPRIRVPRLRGRSRPRARRLT